MRNGFSWQRFCLVVGRLRLRVLQRVGLEAAVVHPADVPAAGARRRLAARRAVEARTLIWHRTCRSALRRRAPARAYVRRLRHARGRARGRAHAGARSTRRLSVHGVAGLAAAGPASLSARGVRAALGEARRSLGHRRRCRSRSLVGDAARVRRPSTRFGADPLGRAILPRCGTRRRPRARSPPRRCYQIGMYDQTLPFYLRRTTTLVDVPRRVGARARRRAAEEVSDARAGSPRGAACPGLRAASATRHARQARAARRADARARARPAARVRARR